ncbi:MAG: hypothetical protein WBO14_11995 [Gammaproteobacteria bacterium]
MKKHYLYLALGLLFSTSGALAEENGEFLIMKFCASCHVLEGKPTIAPPIFAVKIHVKRSYTGRDAFVQRIVDWVEHPDETIALMPGAVNRFGVMPKLPYKNEDVRKIAEYIYDTDFKVPEWYRKHYKQKHGVEPNH